MQGMSDKKRLLYENNTVIGQGEELLMKNLKLAIEQLVIDSEIISRVTEYGVLMNQLTNDEQIKYMNTVIRVSYSDSWRSCTRWLSCL
jgi:hypothetical protein